MNRSIAVFSLVFLVVVQAHLSDDRRLAKMRADIERVTLNPEFHKRGENLFSPFMRSEEGAKKLSVRNLKESDIQPDVYENPISFMAIGCISELVCWGIDTSYSVYKSGDSMMHWTAISAISTTAQVAAIHISPVDNSSIYFLGRLTTSYVTRDGGNTFQQINTNVHVEGLQLHPHVTEIMIGNDGNDNLYYSDDFGASWAFVKAGVYDYDFCNGAISDRIPRICMITQMANNPSSLIRTDDLGIHLVELLPVSVDYIVPHRRHTFVIGNKPNSADKTMYVSPSQGEDFHQILLPMNLNVPYFTPDQILEDRGAIWIGVNHDGQWGGLHDGFIYVGDGTGYRFTQTFEHVATKNNWWDFDAIRSIEGAYITNMLLTWETDVPGGHNNEYDQELKTYLTYDDGDNWNTLKAPDTDIHGNQLQCIGSCSLNLFGKTTWLGVGGYGYYGDFWSSRNAVGMILATGNTGDSLLFQPDQVNTYMSVDAGVSWDIIAEGSSVYEFGDMGGVLVMAHNQVSSNTLYFSLDQGQTWTAFNFTTSPVIIVNVYAASDKYGKFVVFGVRNNKVVYFGIDFTNAGLPTCSSNDFEEWKLQSRHCLLGRDIIYNRKLRNSICKHSADYNPIKSVTNCSCTVDDYECDEGYEFSIYQRNCLKVDNSTPPCSEDGTYWQSSGYRIIPDDSCTSPLQQYEPTLVHCTYPNTLNHMSKSVIAAIASVILLIVGAAVFIGFLIGLKNERFRSKFSWVKLPGKFHNVGYDNKIQMIDDEEESQ